MLSAQITGDKLEISVSQLIESLSDEDKIAFIESLSCDDAIIKHVSDQIIDGWTESGYYGGKCGATAEPITPLDKAIRRVALAANDVAAKQIKDLERALRWEHAYREGYSTWAWNMWHNGLSDDGRRSFQPPKQHYDENEYVVVKKGQVK